ncbi:MAG: Holliday junction resolvase RuvX [Gemmatimonadetes bacterium]|nr:Holliday junction resolvase RuvX [Gemmatimonadota bacterium]
MMGVDFGARRIGVALSDPTRTLASPVDTLLRRRGKRPPWKALEALAREHAVGRVVMGLPLGLDGEETPWCAEIREAGEELGRRLGVPVDYVDERFTSASAERAIRGSGLPRKERERKERVDAGAAALILQRWLDGERER